MSLTQKLKQFELGLIPASTFRDSIRSRRSQTLRSSLYRDVGCAWTTQQRFIDDNAVAAGYLSIDIDQTDVRYLLAGCANGCVEIFDLDPLSQSPKQNCSRIAAVTKSSNRCHKSHCNWVQWYSNDNGIFVTSSHDKTVKVWDANEMTVVESFDFNMPVFMHDLGGNAANGVAHNLIAVASDESNVRLADMRTGAQSQHLHGYHKQGVVSVQWSPHDSNVLLSGDRDGRLLAWDIRSGKSFLKSLRDSNTRKKDCAHDHPIVALKFAPARECLRLVSLDTEGELRIWDALTLNLIKRASVRFRESPRSLKTVRLDFACHNFEKREHNFLFIPTGANVDVISLTAGRKLKTLSGHMMPSFSCSYRGGDYQELYTASYDKTIGCFRPEHDDNPEFHLLTGVEAKGQRQVANLTQDTWSDSD